MNILLYRYFIQCVCMLYNISVLVVVAPGQNPGGRHLQARLRLHCPKCWSRQKPPLSAPQASTGFTPFKLLFGLGHEAIGCGQWKLGNPALPLSFHDWVQKLQSCLEKVNKIMKMHVVEAKKAQEQTYYCPPQPREFRLGGKVHVLVPDSNKVPRIVAGPIHSGLESGTSGSILLAEAG